MNRRAPGRAPGRTRSLRSTLMMSLVVALVVPGVLIMLLYAFLAARMTAAFDDALEKTAVLLASGVEREQTVEGITPLQMEAADQEHPLFAITSELFVVWSPDGDVAVRSPALGFDTALTPPRLDPPAFGGISKGFTDVELPNDVDGRAVAVRFWPLLEVENEQGDVIEWRTDRTGAATLMLVRDRGPLDNTLMAIWMALAGTALLLIICGLIAVWWTVRRGLEPLTAWGEQVAALDASALDQTDHPAWRPPTELAPVADQLRGLLGRVADVLRRERRFSNDVAHELRTPVAEIRTAAEVALRRSGVSGSSRQTLTDIAGSAQDVSKLLDALLALRRSEGGEQYSDLLGEPFDVAAMVRNYAEASRSNERSDVTLSLDLPASLTASFDQPLFGAAARNLLDNASRYADADTTIAVRLRSDAGVIQLEVENSASRLQLRQVARMTEPFWRADESRGHHNGEHHVGLGLTLTADYTKRLGGSLDLELQGHRLLARLSVPNAVVAQPG